jgi:predicted dehydrogenase
MKSLIIGMGIGNLYQSVLENLNHQIVTVDSNTNLSADYINFVDAIRDHVNFDTVHICTPNFTHETIARAVAPHARIVFVEKPGLEDSNAWGKLITDFPNTRFMMVKNNMWRDNIKNMIQQVSHSKTVKFKWINKNRIPKPGSWFTNKELAYGGVSRDLMPHLLSLYVAVNQHWQETVITGYEARRQHELKDITSTEYGEVNLDGVYNVDDVCKIKFIRNGLSWKLESNWADGREDNRAIEFELHDGTVERIELGLCPESAYNSMIKDAIAHANNDAWWLQQNTIDIWIHSMLEKFKCE